MPITKTLTAALVGNPNTGKSTLFNALTGLRQHVGNYPGVTVEFKKGKARLGEREIEFIDLPGTYSLAARSLDEMVAVDILLGHGEGEPRPDAIVSIVDACNLERHLYLTTQLMDLGLPMVLAVNFTDVADTRGLKIDYHALSEKLGMPVVPIQANRGLGIEELKTAIAAAAESGMIPQGPTLPGSFEAEVSHLDAALPEKVEPFLIRRLLLDVNGYNERRTVEKFGPEIGDCINLVRQRLAAGGAIAGIEARTRYGWIRKAIANCVERPATRRVTRGDKLDRVFTHRFWGTLIFLGLMFAMFQSIFLWASPLMEAVDGVREWAGEKVSAALDPGPLRSLLVDGVLKGVGSVLVFLPQILILFGFIAVLEDCGYMARAAFLMDRIMSKCGLNGKSFIPLLSSMACAVPGIMATRVIENRRDRIATILVAPLISCSARLPLYLLLIGVFIHDPWWLPGVVLFGMYALGLIVAPLVALLLKRTLLKGETPLFVLELPSFKVPQFRAVVRRMVGAGWAFVYRAGTLIFASMVLVWALLYFPNGGGDGKESFDVQTARLSEEIEALQKQEDVEGKEEAIAAREDALNRLHGEWKRQSVLGRAGLAMEPIFRPLGWDWRIGMAALASFPAREVVVGTLGIIYNVGPDVDARSIRRADAAESPLGRAIDREWNSDPVRGKYRVPVAMSLMVFFALCCQCVSTLAVIKRETQSWLWPLFTFAYMTVLAYVGAFITFQVGKLFVG